MLDQLIISSMYCGIIGSRTSHPTGSPISVMSIRSLRATIIPFSMFPLPSMSGSRISPFQPRFVRGFSKYVLIIMRNSSLSSSLNPLSLFAYSIAEEGSCMLHGPTIARSLLSLPNIISLNTKFIKQNYIIYCLFIYFMLKFK